MWLRAISARLSSKTADILVEEKMADILVEEKMAATLVEEKGKSVQVGTDDQMQKDPPLEPRDTPQAKRKTVKLPKGRKVPRIVGTKNDSSSQDYDIIAGAASQAVKEPRVISIDEQPMQVDLKVALMSSKLDAISHTCVELDKKYTELLQQQIGKINFMSSKVDAMFQTCVQLEQKFTDLHTKQICKEPEETIDSDPDEHYVGVWKPYKVKIYKGESKVELFDEWLEYIRCNFVGLGLKGHKQKLNFIRSLLAGAAKEFVESYVASPDSPGLKSWRELVDLIRTIFVDASVFDQEELAMRFKNLTFTSTGWSAFLDELTELVNRIDPEKYFLAVTIKKFPSEVQREIRLLGPSATFRDYINTARNFGVHYGPAGFANNVTDEENDTPRKSTRTKRKKSRSQTRAA